MYSEEHKPDVFFIAKVEIPFNSNLNFLKIEEYKLNFLTPFELEKYLGSFVSVGHYFIENWSWRVVSKKLSH